MFYVMPPSDEGGGFLRSKKTEGEKTLPLSRLPPTAPLTRGADKDLKPIYGGAAGCRSFLLFLPRFGEVMIHIAAGVSTNRIIYVLLKRGKSIDLC